MSILNKIIGSRILAVLTVDCQDPRPIKEDSISCDSGDIYIILDNGYILKVWNSEFGGVIKDKCKDLEEKEGIDTEFISQTLEYVKKTFQHVESAVNLVLKKFEKGN